MMPACIFILSRFRPCVDNAFFRVHDTRIYHPFASAPPLVIRLANALRARQAGTGRILPCVPTNPTPKLISHFLMIGSAAAGPDAAHRHFPTCMPKETSHEAGTGTGWCGLGTVVQDRGRRGVTCLYAFGEVILTSRKCRVCTYCKLDLSLSVPASWWSTNAL